MRKRKYLWEVTRLGGSPETSFIIGSVYAADQNQARKTAIKQLKVHPDDQWRLLLRRAA
jgi:hypothetical protein